jgi:biopolymer transport protein ExbB
MPRRQLATLLLILASAVFSPHALAWWNDDWAFRKEITLDSAAAGVKDEVVDAPVLVRLSIANFPYFADARPDGADFRVVAADDKSELKFHFEKFDAQSQVALLWVRVPRLPVGASEKIYIYYGNAKAGSAADAAATYDASQALAYHFAEAAGPFDSASYKVEPRAAAVTAEAGALIGAGLAFDGVKTLAIDAVPQLRVNAAQGFTASAWLKPDAARPRAVVAAFGQGGNELSMGLEGGKAFGRWRGGGQDVTVRQPDGDVSGDWHHLTLRATATALDLVLDGAVVASSPIKLTDFDAAAVVGGPAADQGQYRGLLDEFEISGVARKDGWITVAAKGQGVIAPLITYGGDVQKEGGEESQSYFASTLRNVTVDGWVIIGVLSVMFVFAVLIMMVKVVYLNRVAAGNQRFLDAFQQQGAGASRDVSPVEATPERYGTSTLWRLYDHGMREMRGRLDAQRPVEGADRAMLSAQSIEAIRATLDATQTRMTQKLQSQMVWLTIAISGGPFLGLLGTVVGVMITFAAIAASGDVNINAIAPGTAAALVATVAGLGVAIPCLFGYNYLNSRIKTISADMRVFTDEFVTRVAETYS